MGQHVSLGELGIARDSVQYALGTILLVRPSPYVFAGAALLTSSTSRAASILDDARTPAGRVDAPLVAARGTGSHIAGQIQAAYVSPPRQRADDRLRLPGRSRDHSRPLKPLLLDQSFVAGVGNIYADEAVHRAGLHPRLRSDRVTPAQARALWRAIRAVLREAIRWNGTTFDQVYGEGDFQRHLRVYQRTGRPCRRCGTPIRRIVVGQRGTHFCPRCQVGSPR